MVFGRVISQTTYSLCNNTYVQFQTKYKNLQKKGCLENYLAENMTKIREDYPPFLVRHLLNVARLSFQKK